MCLAVPGKIVSIDASDPYWTMAKVSFGGIEKDVCVQWIDDPAIGDYVMVHVGAALTRVDEKEALETLNYLHQLGEIDYNSSWYGKADQETAAASTTVDRQ